MTPAGYHIRCGKKRKVLYPSLIKVPRLAAGAGIPIPMKLRKASKKIAAGKANITWTIIRPNILGRMWRNIILRVDWPSTRAAKTYSCCLIRMVWARTTRDMEIQLVKAMVIIMDTIPGWSTKSMRITMTKLGIPDRISKIRCMRVSILPPNQPETKP